MIALLLDSTLLKSNSDIRNGYDDIVLKNAPIRIGENLAKLNTIARDSFRNTKFKSWPDKTIDCIHLSTTLGSPSTDKGTS